MRVRLESMVFTDLLLHSFIRVSIQHRIALCTLCGGNKKYFSRSTYEHITYVVLSVLSSHKLVKKPNSLFICIALVLSYVLYFIYAVAANLVHSFRSYASQTCMGGETIHTR